jgi:hypothetical protein
MATFRVLTAALVALTCVACGHSASPEAEPDVGAIPVRLSSADLRLPLDAYIVDGTQLAQIDNGRLVLTERCMRRLGFGTELSIARRDAPAKLLGNQRRYGITDEAAAAVYGYRVPPGVIAEPTGGAGTDPSEKVELSAAERTALSGNGSKTVNDRPVPEGGCVGEARRKLAERGPRVDRPELAEILAGESFDLSRKDSRVRAALGSWSRCMKARGFDLAGPLDAANNPAFKTGSEPEAIATATADVACKKQTNLVGVWSTVEDAYQKRIIERNHEELRRIKDSLAAQLRYAAELG